MLFNSLDFIAFLVIVLGLYRMLGHRGQNNMLLLASYAFYAAWDWRFLALIWISTLVDFVVGRAIFERQDPMARRRLLFVSVAVNLSILGFFKYFGFFISNAAAFLDRLGFQVSVPALYIVLPIGISFYTFQTMTYTIDIFRGEMEPIDSIRDFGLYVCYFPQLVAGPIERAGRLLPQIQKPRRVTASLVASGLALILIGMFRKVVIADGIGATVDQIFRAPAGQGSARLWLGAYLFALQIYCDFAGYSGIARGTSRLFGIELIENFRQPYFSSNVSEFWRRWHISLSTWLRDYLYIPLGGGRGGSLATLRNLMITMLLGGLWHGAAWTFVIWGGLHGTYLAVYHAFRQRLRQFAAGMSRVVIPRPASVLLTFHLVLITWVFFRAPGLRASLGYLQQMMRPDTSQAWLAAATLLIVPWGLSLFVDYAQIRSQRQAFMIDWRPVPRMLCIGAMFYLILLSFGRNAPFIYFQF